MVLAVVNVPVKLAALEIVWPLIAPEVVIVPIFTKFPETSMRLVPAPAPVLMPVVPLIVVPVIVEAVAMVPKPEAIVPETKAPVLVMLSWVAVGMVEEMEGTPVPEVMRTPLLAVAKPVTVLAPLEYNSVLAP